MTNAQLQALLNDPNTNPVVIPAGDIVIDTRLTVPRSNVTIQGAGPTTRLLLRGDNKLTEVTGTLSAQTPANGLHASGLVTAGATNSLTVDDPTPYSSTPGAINNTVFLRLGVSAADPHEAQDRVWATIGSIVGNVLTFNAIGPAASSTFTETIPTYSSSDLSWTTYPGRTGVYGTVPPDGGNLIARGYGTDHTIYAFSSLADNVVWQDMNFGLAVDVGTAPIWSLGTKWCRNCLFQRVTVEDFIGNAMTSFESIGTTLTNFSILTGRALAVVGQPHYPPIVFNSWGGRDTLVSNGIVNVPNAQIVGTEGAKNTKIGPNVFLNTQHDPRNSATVPTSFWTANGLGTGVIGAYPPTVVDGLVLTGVMNAAIAQQKEDVGLTAKNAKFQCSVGNFINLQNFDGTLEICGIRYRTIVNQSGQVTIPIIGAGGRALLALPQGLYRRAFVKFDTPGTYTSGIKYPSGNFIYTDPNNSSNHMPPAGAWVELTNFYQVQSFSPSNPDTYFSTVKQLQCFGTANAAATTCTLDIDYWPNPPTTVRQAPHGSYL